MNINSPSVEVKNLSVNLGGKEIISNLSLRLSSPSFVAIVGHNGTGKTTFLNAFVGNIAYKGNFFISSEEVSDFLEWTSVLYQDNSLGFDMSVKDMVVMGLYWNKKLLDHYTSADYKKVSEVLHRLNIAHLENHQYQTLSGGEKQLVWLAQTLLTDREILFLDEPTRGLDVKNKAMLFELIGDLVKEGKYVFCITHDIEYLKEMDGMVINFAKSSPMLEDLSGEVIDHHFELLKA